MHTQTHMCIHTLEKQIYETQSSLRLSHVCIKNNSRFCHSEKLHSAVGSSNSRPCGESGTIECSALSGTVYPAPQSSERKEEGRRNIRGRRGAVGRGKGQQKWEVTGASLLTGTGFSVFIIKVAIMFHQHLMKSEILMKTLSEQTSHSVLFSSLAR